VAAEVTLREPVTAPTANGENATPTVQLAPAGSDTPQVVLAEPITNPAVTPRVRSLIGEPPELVTVTSWVVLVWPVRTALKES
jgi:hypothetical protein